MKILTTIAQVREQVQAWRKAGETIGLVPTMGYLHEGHASLIDASHQQNTKTVVSIFVNPMQFGENEDFDSYPRDLEHDAALAEAHGADVIFHPEPEELYPAGFCSYVDMDILTKELRVKPPHSLPRCLHGCQQTLSHCYTGSGLLWQKRCTATGCYSPYGNRSEYESYHHRLPDHPGSRRSCKKFPQYLLIQRRTCCSTGSFSGGCHWKRIGSAR